MFFCETKDIKNIKAFFFLISCCDELNSTSNRLHSTLSWQRGEQRISKTKSVWLLELFCDLPPHLESPEIYWNNKEQQWWSIYTALNSFINKTDISREGAETKWGARRRRRWRGAGVLLCIAAWRKTMCSSHWLCSVPLVALSPGSSYNGGATQTMCHPSVRQYVNTDITPSSVAAAR